MFITKKAISRRTMLRGLGAAVALPLLDAMVPASTALAQTPASPVRRLSAFFIPNGANPVEGQWFPTKPGPITDVPPQLAAFESVKDKLFLPGNLRHAQADAWGDGGGDHARGCAAWLSGVHIKRTAGPDIRAAVTIDQMAAKEWGKYTKLASLETSMESIGSSGACTDGYACGYEMWFSWSTPTTPLHHEPNPRLVFERLFGDGSGPAEQKLRMQREQSLLDSLTGEISRMNKQLGNTDRATLDEYLTSMRDVERRIKVSEDQVARNNFTPPQLPDELPDTFEEHAKMILDLQVLGFQADVTRVATTLIGREQGSRSYLKSGISDGHHGMSHHQNEPEKLAKLTKIVAYLLKTGPGYFAEKLNSIKEGDGTLLDNSLVIFGGGLGDPNIHNHLRLPIAVVGGAAGNLKGGRYIKYPDNTSMSNLLVSVMNKSGFPIDKIGDSSGPLADM